MALRYASPSLIIYSNDPADLYGVVNQIKLFTGKLESHARCTR